MDFYTILQHMFVQNIEGTTLDPTIGYYLEYKILY